MWDSLSSVGFAQTLFYIPAVLVAGLLLFRRRHETPLVQWVVLLVFSLVRFVGGIVLMFYISHASEVAYIIATIVLQDSGVVPLLVSLILHIRVVKLLDFPENEFFRKLLQLTRIFLFTGLGAVLGGSAVMGNYKNADMVRLGPNLAKSGYLIVTLVVLAIWGYAVILWTQRAVLSPNSRKMLLAVIISVPFLIVRLVYALLSFFDTGSTWDLSAGAVVPFVMMHSVMEYCVVVICLFIGMTVDPLISRNPRNQITHQQLQRNPKRIPLTKYGE